MTANTRVLIYVLNSGNLYGTERMALATLAGMRDYAEIVVLAPPAQSSGSVLAEASRLGYVVAPFLRRRDFLRAILPWFLKFRQVDMIGTGVGQSYMSFALSLMLGVRLGQLQVAHGGTEAWHSYGSKRRLNRIPVRLIAVSGYVRDQLIEHGLRPDRVDVIENFIVFDQAGVPARAPFDPRREAAVPLTRSPRVAVVSRIDRIKRIDLLVDAVAAGGLDGFRFEIYGTGKELEGLKERAAALPQISFHGFAADIPERLAQADFLLHLCPEEPFGLVILEAHLARLLVIVPDSGGAGSIVDEGVTGLHFRANDAADLRRVLRAARDLEAAQLQNLVDNGRASLSHRFSPAQGIHRYRQVLGIAVESP